MIEPSQLGMVTTTTDMSSGFSGVPTPTFFEGDETYSMPYGKHHEIRNHYTEDIQLTTYVNF